MSGILIVRSICTQIENCHFYSSKWQTIFFCDGKAAYLLISGLEQLNQKAIFPRFKLSGRVMGSNVTGPRVCFQRNLFRFTVPPRHIVLCFMANFP